MNWVHIPQDPKGHVSVMLAGAVVRETAIPGPVQRPQPGVQPDGAVGRRVLLPPAAALRHCQTGDAVLLQEDTQT